MALKQNALEQIFVATHVNPTAEDVYPGTIVQIFTADHPGLVRPSIDARRILLQVIIARNIVRARSRGIGNELGISLDIPLAAIPP